MAPPKARKAPHRDWCGAFCLPGAAPSGRQANTGEQLGQQLGAAARSIRRWLAGFNGIDDTGMPDRTRRHRQALMTGDDIRRDRRTRADLESVSPDPDLIYHRVFQVASGTEPMKRYVEYPLDGGGSVIVEVDQPPSGLVPAASDGEVVAKARERFDDALDAVRPIAGKLLAKLRDLPEAPDEVAVEFGVNLGFNAGVVIASGSTGANVKVALKWTRPPAPEPPG